MVALAFGLGAILVVTLFLQQDRIAEAFSRGGDGSLDGRLLYPLDYMIHDWTSPFLGSGPTPNQTVSDYVDQRYIVDGGRTWLVNLGYRSGIAPTLMLVISAGFGGTLIFVFSCMLFLGKRGAVLVAVFLAANLFNVGTNSPPMYVPSAILLAAAWWSMTSRRSAVDRVQTRSMAASVGGLPKTRAVEAP